VSAKWSWPTGNFVTYSAFGQRPLRGSVVVRGPAMRSRLGRSESFFGELSIRKLWVGDLFVVLLKSSRRDSNFA